jgi:[protein-PII] uridylyltransferase
VKRLQRHEGTQKLIRARLHCVAGGARTASCSICRPAGRRHFGYQGTTTMRASEMLMQRYYWAAKAVTQLNQVLLLNLEERINGSGGPAMQRLNERFLDRGGLIEVDRRRPVRARAARDPRDLPPLPDHAGPQGPVDAHAARAVQRCATR